MSQDEQSAHAIPLPTDAALVDKYQAQIYESQKAIERAEAMLACLRLDRLLELHPLIEGVKLWTEEWIDDEGAHSHALRVVVLPIDDPVADPERFYNDELPEWEEADDWPPSDPVAELAQWQAAERADIQEAIQSILEPYKDRLANIEIEAERSEVVGAVAAQLLGVDEAAAWMARREVEALDAEMPQGSAGPGARRM